MSYEDEIWIEDEKEVCLIKKLTSSQLQNQLRVDPLSKQGVQDLLLLYDLNEYNCLHNLRVRYSKELIYTQVGSPILISINPYQVLPALYSQETLAYYRVKLGQSKSTLKTSVREQEFEPHLFKIAQLSLDQLFESRANELRICSMIISGESGSGKTESTKILLRYLAAESKSGLFRTIQQGITVEQQIFASNPVLEAFGNAKTARNDNSSRFGKFMHLYFNPDTKRVSRAKIDNYLLEKSRVVKISPIERNYHIFYQLIAAKIPELKLKTQNDYEYLKNGDLKFQKNDQFEFQETDSCLNNLQFTENEKKYIYQTIAGILHLGNVKINYNNNLSVLVEDESLKLASQFLGISIPNLNNLICKVFSMVGKEVVTRNNNQENSISSRDTLAKHIYDKLFNWLIEKINLQLLNLKSLSFQNQLRDEISNYMVGILDIFGFEIFTDANGLHCNSFEQLNINFTNEKLQQHFNQHMFIEEQREYEKEEIKWDMIKFPDNKKILDLIENSSMSIYKMLIDQTIVVNRGDKEFLNSLKNLPKDHLVLVSDLQTADLESRFDKKIHRIAKFDWFCLKHYAGAVAYNVAGFVEKNRDTINTEVYKVLPQSQNPVIKVIWENVENSNLNMKQNNVVTRFQNSLKDLLDVLNRSLPKYIRCIKPNNNKSPLTIDAREVKRQMTCAGLMEAIQIRKAGYQVRQKHQDFIKKYRNLINQKVTNINDIIKSLKTDSKYDQIFKNQQEGQYFQIGKTRIFMKDYFRDFLDEKLIEFRLKYIIKIQKQFRIYKRIQILKQELKKLHLKLKKIASAFQRYRFRKIINQRILQRKKIKKLIKSITKLQKKFIQRQALKDLKNYVQQLKEIEQAQLMEDVEIIQAESSADFSKLIKTESFNENSQTEQKQVIKQEQQENSKTQTQQNQDKIQKPHFLKQTVVTQPKTVQQQIQPKIEQQQIQPIIGQQNTEIKHTSHETIQESKEIVQSQEIKFYEDKLGQLMQELEEEKTKRIKVEKVNEQMQKQLQKQSQQEDDKQREQVTKLENEIFRRDQIIHDLNVKLNEYSKQVKQSFQNIRNSEVQDIKIQTLDTQLQQRNDQVKIQQELIKSLNKGWRLKILENEAIYNYYNLKTYQQRLPIYEKFDIIKMIETGELLQKQIKDLQQQVQQALFESQQ